MKTPAGRSRSASWPEVDALIATSDRIGLSSIGTAIMLSLFQGQRETDVFQAVCGEFSERITTTDGTSRARIAVLHSR